MQDVYLGSQEAAAYLGIKERKLYELVGAGRIPATKATGKWLFPRLALDRWLEAALVIPPGYAPSLPPLIIAGSQDPLLDWAARRAGSGLAILAEGSEAGLLHLERNEAAIAAIHLHKAGESDANLAAVRSSPHLADAVVIGFAEREQGLMLGQGRHQESVSEAVESQLVFGSRQPGAGAQLLLEKLIDEAGIASSLIRYGGEFATSEDLAFAISARNVDCGIGTRAVAQKYGLHFVPIAWEAFDLVIRRRTYFERAAQMLFDFLRTEIFHEHAHSLGGYRTTSAGSVRLNR